jgi:hypothetical protein
MLKNRAIGNVLSDVAGSPYLNRKQMIYYGVYINEEKRGGEE